ncbi:hypothetical protein [Desulfosporosinus sp. FKB]|uniref:hypothetical protein n=1 Tax=Desulfosporosinus sp. FKB TaxID=1969835 RepID=UPI000B49D25F|nr:hypothetical protein [Desulfosporosinus sp. FKB]
MEDLTLLEKKILIRRLETLSKELEELEEERDYVLKQTGLHLPGHTVKKYEAELSILKNSLVLIQKELARRE